MLPIEGDVRQAAYERWERRGRGDGLDRDDWLSAQEDLLFRLNYQNIVEIRLDARSDLIASDRASRCCRFCDRMVARVDASQPLSLFPGGLSAPIFTRAFCDECRAAFRDALAADFGLFWAALAADDGASAATGFSRAREQYSLSVYKAFIVCALAIMPENELRYFPDTLEWVSNLESSNDAQLVRNEATCRVYSPLSLLDQSWTSLMRRRDPDVPFPYMLVFVAQDGVVVQAQLPMCLCDQDLDGRAVRIPRRSFAAEEGDRSQEARAWDLPILSKIPKILSKPDRSS